MNRIIVLISIALIFAAGCTQEEPIGGETDEHGCLPAAGYTWCEAKEKCLREWEEPCEENLNAEEAPAYAENGQKMTEEEARQIAEQSPCMEEGNLTGAVLYNNYTTTWWFDLDTVKEGCAPACVVDEETDTAEINWRCTGALPE